MKGLGVSKSRAYARIDEAVRRTRLPRHVAALLVASDAGVNFSRFASEADLATMRGVHIPHAEPPKTSAVSVPADATPGLGVGRRVWNRVSKVKKSKTGNQVFVVHGRNERIRKSLFAFLRALGVQPIEWNKALAMTRKGSPYVGEVIDAAFDKAKVIVVLLTPDDEAKLKTQFVRGGDPSFERRLTGQPRPNVLFEAGMAFGRQPNTTILVQVGRIRAVSDVAGRHIVHLSDSMASRQQLVAKLKATGLDIDDIGDDWHSEGDFS